MKKVNETGIRDEIRTEVNKLKNLLASVEPSERLLVLNEVITSLLPERKSTRSCNDKLNKKRQSRAANLSPAQLQLIRGMSDATARLHDLTGDDRA